MHIPLLISQILATSPVLNIRGDVAFVVSTDYIQQISGPLAGFLSSRNR